MSVFIIVSLWHGIWEYNSESYFPDRADMSNLHRLISCWWTMANSRKKLTPNFLNEADILNDGKIDFYKILSECIEFWANISDFCLTKQTSKAFVITLRREAMLMQELLDEGYEFIFTRRFQSDPLKHRFSQYRQMSGGRFLESLREVLITEWILTCRSLLKQNINFWEESLKPIQKNDKILNILAQHESETKKLSCHQTAKK